MEGGGRWRTATAEIARGPMLAVTEPGVRVITAMACTQILKSSLLLSTAGYFAHIDPCPMLLVQPKDTAAADFAKERLGGMIEATPALRDLVGTRRMRSGEEKIGYKPFPGGFIAIVSAGSPTNLASRPIRVVLYDEIDKYVPTREGDAIALGDERLARFANALSIRVCSPTVEGESRIEASWLQSDQRRASVACPHCGHRQFLDFFRHVQWQKDEDGKHLPKTAAIYCEACGAAWSEGERLRSLTSIRWHQTRSFRCCGQDQQPLEEYDRAWRALDGDAAHDDALAVVWDWWESERWGVYRARCRCCGAWAVDNEHAGFQASKLYSPWTTKDAPPQLAKKWLDAQVDEDLKQTFWNTQLGLPHKSNAGKETPTTVLLRRREVWAAEVPDPVAVLTMGQDTQDDRIELEVVGWGRDEESWSIAYEVIPGRFDDPAVQAQVDAFRRRAWLRADGRPFKIAATCVDSGGHHTEAVYAFCRDRAGEKVWAIKGASDKNGAWSPVWPTSAKVKRSKRAYRPVIIGTNAAKESIANRLQIAAPGPGYMHFPADRDTAYFEQLTAERLVTVTVGGRKYRKWEPKPGRANEALDCRVYAFGALRGLAHWGLKLNKKADEVGAAAEVEPVLAGTPEAEAVEREREERPAIEPVPEKSKRRSRRVAKFSMLMR